MELNEYQEKALKTVLWGKCYNQQYLLSGLTEEVGEINGKIKRIIRDGNPMRLEDGDLVIDEAQLNAIALEIGDALWYLTILSHKLGFSLEDVAQMNVDKLADRMARGVINGKGDER